MIKSATTGSTSELLRCREIAHRARPGPPGPPLKPRLEICTERLDPSPSRLRLAVVYAEQPPAASSTNAGGVCSAGPSGVGLGRHAGTVASARTKLGRPEEQQAERAGAVEASTLPPSSRGKVELHSTTLKDPGFTKGSSLVVPCACHGVQAWTVYEFRPTKCVLLAGSNAKATC